MKQGIHPRYGQLTVTCACGNSFVTGSTKDAIKVEICSACHPFFTGEMRFVDTMGRVERFQKKQQAASPGGTVKKRQKRLLKIKRDAEIEAAKPKTIRELLERAKKEAAVASGVK